MNKMDEIFVVVVLFFKTLFPLSYFSTSKRSVKRKKQKAVTYFLVRYGRTKITTSASFPPHTKKKKKI